MGAYAICRGCRDEYGTMNQCMSANYSTAFPFAIIKNMKCPHGYDNNVNWEAIEGKDYPDFPYNAKSFESQSCIKTDEKLESGKLRARVGMEDVTEESKK